MTWHSSEPTVTIVLAVAKPVFDATTVIGPLRSYTPAYVQSGGPKVVSGVTSVPMWTTTFASQMGPFGPMLLYQPSLWLNHLARSRILPCSTDFLAPRS